MREDDGVAVVVEHVGHCVRLHERADLSQHEAPLKLVFGLVRSCVLVWGETFDSSKVPGGVIFLNFSLGLTIHLCCEMK